MSSPFAFLVNVTRTPRRNQAPPTVQNDLLCAFNILFTSLYEKDEVRAYFILIQSPVFAAQSSYTIFAHLLRQIVELPTVDHQLLVFWFRT